MLGDEKYEEMLKIEVTTSTSAMDLNAGNRLKQEDVLNENEKA